MSGLKLFHTTTSGATEVAPRLAEVEADIQSLVEAHMETLLGVRFLASEYGTGPVHGGRIDSLGLDENGAPIIVEYKRGVDAGVINQGLFYLSWLMDHRAEFEHLVRDRLFGGDLLGLETVASVSGGTVAPRRVRRQAVARAADDVQGASMVELADAIDQALLGLGDGVNRVERKQYRAYQRLRNFACVCPPQRSKLLVYLKADPKGVDLVPGFTRDVTWLGHHGTGDLEVQLRTPRDVERAQELFRASYAAA
ncbi:DUF5655 domain-containing protein [Streptomyces niveus]|uniref:DUF5655 domain-containing protein n=1 Tax=Streptomyces niveus TaxID=193462 RepID=UPI00368B3DBD